MTTNRPPLARKHTRTTEAARKAALEAGIRMTIDGESYTVRMGDGTPAIARTLRRYTGMGFNSFLSALASDPDTDLVSAFVWVARTVAGERLDFEDVQVTFAQMLGDDFDVEDISGPDEGDDRPEA